MKVYRNIIIILSILVAVFAISFFWICSEKAHLAITEPVTEEYFQLLKENALIVAKTLDKTALTDETLTADFLVNTNELIVTVESVKAKVTAKIPTFNYSTSIEENTIIIQESINFDNVEFEQENELPTVWHCFTTFTAAGLILGISFYTLFYKFWEPLLVKNKK